MLDPLDVREEQVCSSTPKSSIPTLTAAQIKFGYIPDRSALRPGDLLLTQSAGFSVTSQVIKAGQSRQGPQAVWTHAAIYVSDWRVFEAVPGSHVTSNTILSWVPGMRIMVRRPRFFMGLENSEALIQGQKLVIEAALLQGRARYGKVAAAFVPFREYFRLSRFAPVQPEMRNVSIICSGLYAKCFYLSTSNSLFPLEMLRTDEPVTPALLASIDTMETINVGWSRLV